MDAITLLKNDHQEAKKLMAQIARETSPEKCKQWFGQLKALLQVHTVLEFDAFYPAVESQPRGKGLVLEAHEEHHEIDLLMDELDKLDSEEETWKPKFLLLQKDVLRHATEEETVIFKFARAGMPRRELGDLGAKMEEMKKQQLKQRGTGRRGRNAARQEESHP